MDAPLLIGLYAPMMQSGKTEIGKVLQLQHGFHAVKFADPFKAQIRMLLKEGGATEALIERMIDGDLKETVIPSIGTSVRVMTQQLGSWGRAIHPDFWVNLATPKIDQYLKAGFSVVVDDLRFPNEYEALIRMGGYPVRVSRPGNRAYTNHPSEGLLESYPMTTIENNGSLEQLWACASSLPALLRRQD